MKKFGMIALVATVIHEVPHEFSDFALLLRDGYSRKKAICFQVNIFFLFNIVFQNIYFFLYS